MHIFYFLPLAQQFNLLREVASSSKNEIGVIFRRFTPSGFPPGYKVYSWEDDLEAEYKEGKYSQIYLSVNGAVPESHDDWSFPDREQQNLVVIENGREMEGELEKSYLRVFSKITNCKPFYQKFRKQIKNNCHQGLFIRNTFDMNIFYSDDAKNLTMIFEFGGEEYTCERI